MNKTGYAPWRLALVTLMQFREGLSDRQAAEAVRARIDWKYLLALDIIDPGFDLNLLCEFRGRLLQHGVSERLLARILHAARDQGPLKARGRQRTDSTPVLAAVRNLNRVELLPEALRAALNAIATAAPAWLHALAPPEWHTRYDHRVEETRLEQAEARGCPGLVERSLLTSIAGLKAQAAEIKQGIATHIAAEADLQSGLERLMTIPAVCPKTATRMLLMLRTRAFDSARQAAAFLGLVPVERISGTSVRGRPSLSRAGNPRLRAALYMGAVVGIRKNPDIKVQYERLIGRGKCKMAALGAAMRKLVHLCFGVLKDEGSYRPGVTSGA